MIEKRSYIVNFSKVKYELKIQNGGINFKQNVPIYRY